MMLIQILGEDQEVVHIDIKPSFIDFLLEPVTHVTLECCRRVGKTTEHYCGFEQSIFSGEHHLPSILRVYLNVIIL